MEMKIENPHLGIKSQMANL